MAGDTAPEAASRAELFRPAAVAAHRAGAAVGRDLPTSRRLTSWAYRGLVALVALAVAAGFLIHVEETSAGVWASAGDGPRIARAAFPIGALTRLARGQRVVLHTAAGDVKATINGVIAEPAAAVTSLLGVLPRSLRAPGVVALVTLSVSVPVVAGGKATAHLARRSVAAELIPGLRHG